MDGRATVAAVQAGGADDTSARMSHWQYAIVALCCLCNLADGFDVASLALVAPVLSKDWEISPETLGVIFTAASVGLALGAFLIAPLADRFGRRPLMLTAIGSLAVTLALTGAATGIVQMLVLRFLTGLALGTLVVCLNTTVAEFSTVRARNVSLALLHIGFSLGMATAGAAAATFLGSGDWRGVFYAAASLNVLTFVLALFLLGESPMFLLKRRAAGDLERYNRLERLMARGAVSELPALPGTQAGGPAWGMRNMLAPALRSETVLVWVTALTYAVVGYFLMSWKPTVLANAGLSPSLAALSVTIGSAFGVLGHLSIGIFARRFGEGQLTAVYFLCAVVTLLGFGLMPAQPVPLILMAGLTNFFVVGAYTGLFLVAVVIYPPESRNTGLGFMVGFVRVGAAIGPIIGGVLLGAGLTRMDTYFVFSAIAVIPAVTMYLATRLASRRIAATPSSSPEGPDVQSAARPV